MRYRYRGGAWEGESTPPPESVIRALADDLLQDSPADVLNRALHEGLQLEDGERYPGLDSVRQNLQEQVTESWTDVDWDVVREHLQKAPGAAGSDGASSGSSKGRELASSAQQARMEARLGASGQLQTLADDLAQDSAHFTGLPSPLRHELEKLRNLGELLDLEAALGSASRVQDLERVDLELLRNLIGDDRAARFADLVSMLRQVEAGQYVNASGSALGLSPRALRLMAQQFLQRDLDQESPAAGGRHQSRSRSGIGERNGLTRPLRDGESMDLAVGPTVLEAARRGTSPPVEIRRDDFQVFERDSLDARHTVLAIDLSRSMHARSYLTAAKRLALTLTALVEQRFPRDRVDIIGFSRTAWTVPPHEIAGLEWDRHRTGTNLQDALHLARRTLRGQRRLQRQIILVTDGEPTAFRDANGEVNYVEPPTEQALASTYAEAGRIRRDGIDLTVAVVSAEQRVLDIAKELTKRSQGQLVRVDPENLETDLLGLFARGI